MISNNCKQFEVKGLGIDAWDRVHSALVCRLEALAPAQGQAAQQHSKAALAVFEEIKARAQLELQRKAEEDATLKRWLGQTTRHTTLFSTMTTAML